MGEQVQAQQTGVEDASVAGVQVESQITDTTTEQTDINSGVEHSEVAVQNDEKGFANALKAREEQMRAKLEQEYGTKAKDADRYQQMLERTAKFYGFDSHETYMTALEQAETDRRIQEEADRLGVSEDVIREYVQPLKSELDQLKQRDQQRSEADLIQRVETQIASMESDVTNYPDFAQHKVEVINMAATKGYSLDDAYKILTYDTRITTAQQQAQQDVMRKIQLNADSSTGSLGADAPEQAGGYSSMSLAEKKAFRESVKSGTQIRR